MAFMHAEHTTGRGSATHQTYKHWLYLDFHQGEMLDIGRMVVTWRLFGRIQGHFPFFPHVVSLLRISRSSVDRKMVHVSKWLALKLYFCITNIKEGSIRMIKCEDITVFEQNQRNFTSIYFGFFLTWPSPMHSFFTIFRLQLREQWLWRTLELNWPSSLLGPIILGNIGVDRPTGPNLSRIQKMKMAHYPVKSSKGRCRLCTSHFTTWYCSECERRLCHTGDPASVFWSITRNKAYMMHRLYFPTSPIL